MKNYIVFIFSTILSLSSIGQEICDNATDDDLDGFIDLLDGDCSCNSIVNNSLVPSLLPNHNFEEYTSCPFGWDGDDYVVGWWNDFTEPTSDYMNHCGWTTPIQPGSPLLNFPTGDGIMGTYIYDGYNEYIGCKLDTALEAGYNYTFQMNVATIAVDNLWPPNTIDSLPYVAPYIELTLWGSTDALAPYNGVLENVFGCIPFPQWEVIGTAYYVPKEEWSEITFSFMAQKSYRSVIIGAPCILAPEFPDASIPNEFARPYFLWDNGRLNDVSSFGSRIEVNGALCSQDLLLEAVIDTTGATIQWYKEGLALIGETNAVLNAQALGAGEYTVRFSLDGNCEIRTVNIGGSASDTPPTFTVYAADTACSGTNGLFWTSGNADYYSWSPNSTTTGLNNGSTANFIFENTSQVTVTGYKDGCPSDTTFEVYIYQTPSINGLPDTDTSCIGGSYTLELDLSNTQTVSWGIFGSPNQTPSHVTTINDSTYILTPPYNMNYYITAHNYFCSDMDTFFLNINSWLLPNAQGLASTTLGLSPCTVSFQNLSQNTWNPVTYIWDFGNGQTISTSTPSAVNTVYSEPGTYYVSLTADNSGICSEIWYDTIVVHTVEETNLLIPQVFSPNGDQINDELIFDTKFLSSFQMSIVNRWGQKVGELTESNSTWDGTFNGKELPNGTYFYYLTGSTVFEQPTDARGYIELVR